MSLTLFMHPLSSFCQKVLVALYENATPFEGRQVDLGDPTERAELLKLNPLGKFPVLRDEAAGVTVPESTIIIEYLARRHPGPIDLVPTDEARALEVRRWDRFFDLYVELPMQKITGNTLRPADKKDPFGVDQARATLRTAYGMLEEQLGSREWAVGDGFTMADCGATSALFYASRVVPFGPDTKRVAAYYERLLRRPSFARVVKEAEPFMVHFPGG